MRLKIEEARISNIRRTRNTDSGELEITGATLLSVDEAKRLPERLRRYSNWWWLRSPGYRSNLATYVGSDGPIYEYGTNVDYDGRAYVRPALYISDLESSDLRVGDTFEFGGKDFKIISNDMAFCLGDIGRSVFNEIKYDGNDYETSDVKKYVDDWFNEAIREDGSTIK